MRPQELIRKKRDGGKFSAEEIKAFIKGVTDESWADYQITALVMAMFLNGLDVDEQNALTGAMLRSGEVLDFSDIEKPIADKHSTGGVGDKTSLIIAPLVAACGAAVPMISGRGLGHTGGTLDKLESISGYRVNLSLEEFRQIIKKCGFSMIGQTAEIAPADKKLYALRDATATVEYIPLIVASIMSKKLAEGLDALVLDVKTGSGAFMQKLEDSKKLAEAMVKTGKSQGVKTEAVISDMNQPLGKFVGNALEVYECVKILRGEADEKMRPTLELSVELTARMLVLCGIADTIQNSKFKIQNSLESGEALEKFRQNVELQGGDVKVFDNPESLFDKNLIEFSVKAQRAGFISEIDTGAVGSAIVGIGGGRTKAEDGIDHAVGYACETKIGDEVRENETLGVLYCRNETQFASIHKKLIRAYKISDENNLNDSRLIKAVITN
ncbi:MAG TPA: thymidine phosphorylase [Pyrinomonadaceae bacterium]|nr:thymidine phosphorylase [Pyrinomonadaceae bacterium]